MNPRQPPTAAFDALRVPAYPPILLIEPTTRCPLHCRDCPRGEGLIPASRDLPLEAVQLLCRDIWRHGGAEVVRFAGWGEPLLWPHLARAVEMFRRAGVVQVIVTTNGQRLTRELARSMADAGLTELEVSLDAISADRYREARGGELEGVGLEHAFELAGLGVRVALSMVDRWPDGAERVAFLETYGRHERVSVAFVRQLMRLRQGRLETPCDDARWPCPQLWQRTTLGASGRYRYCCNDWTGRTEISRGLPGEFWLGDLERLRAHHLAGRFSEAAACGECRIWSACRWESSFAERVLKEPTAPRG